MNIKVVNQTKDISRVIINDPKTYNSLSTRNLLDLIKVFKKLDNDKNIKVIILEGAGKGFSAGHNLKEVKILSQLIKNNLDLGLNLDTIPEKFEVKRKNSNFIFAMGVDFLHEFFKTINKYNMKSIDNLFEFINKNIFIKKKIQNFADKGFIM